MFEVGDVSRLAVIGSRMAELEVEREEVEMAMADIRTQLDKRPEKNEWRSRAKAALRYRGVDHQAVLREIAALAREQKAINHRISESEQPFPQRFVGIAKVMLPIETFNQIRDLALVGILPTTPHPTEGAI